LSDLGPVAFASPWYSSEIETIDLSGIEDPAVRAALVKIKLAAQEQSRLLMEWHQMLQYGPVPGAYFPVRWQWAQPAAGPFVVAASPWQTAVVPFSFIPVAVSASRGGSGTIDFDIDDDAGNSVFPTHSFTTPTFWNSRADFDAERVNPITVGRLFLNITGASGSAHRMAITLWCKGASRIEP
jgi:hypothetical protein